MSESLDLLDDIGLVLSVFVLLFISYFHLRNLNDDRTWDRKMGAALVIWLLLYFILRRIQEISPSMGIDDPDVSSFILDVTAYSSQLNFYYIHLFLMLLVPIPFLRNGWQIGALGVVVLLFAHIDRTAMLPDADPYYNSLLLPSFLLLAGLVCFSVGLRFLLFPPDVDDTSQEALAMRRSGFFALGTIAVVMDNMVFRAVGFLDGSGNAWWTFPTVNYSGASAGYDYAMITLTEMTIILGAFSFLMIGFGIGAIYHLIKASRKEHPVSLASVFSGYILFIWLLILFRHWAYVSEYASWTMWESPLDDNAAIITALSDGFTFHLIYPTIALLHAVKFGLITIESERDKKILRVVALGVMVAITAVFTTLLEVIIPVPDILLAVACGLVLATGWERYLIDALEPDEEMKTISWAWPGNERAMMIGVNLMIGVPFVIKLFTGVMW
ncbi:MAG: hypothetical protein VXY14_06540 [Candidatus Thermoplasmatota archaeon]|nr:hypothetical protein [Candidatus Thermoplasmatota archaeon]